MKKYLYIYSDYTYGINEKEVIHSLPFYKLKKTTIYKESNGRKILTIYTINLDTEETKFIQQLLLN